MKRIYSRRGDLEKSGCSQDCLGCKSVAGGATSASQNPSGMAQRFSLAGGATTLAGGFSHIPPRDRPRLPFRHGPCPPRGALSVPGSDGPSRFPAASSAPGSEGRPSPASDRAILRAASPEGLCVGLQRRQAEPPRNVVAPAPEWLAQRDRGVARMLRSIASVIGVSMADKEPALPEIQILR